jgi:DUF1680 family protein
LTNKRLLSDRLQSDTQFERFFHSRLNWSSKGLILSQQTNFPYEETTQLVVEDVNPGSFNINVRYPTWVEAGKLEIKVNGAKVAVGAQPDSYVKLNRMWKKGDKIEVRLPMILTTEEMPDSSNYIAFLHGPIVLAAKADTTDLENLVADSNQFRGYRARGKMYSLDAMPVLTDNGSNLAKCLKPVQGKPQTYIAPDLINPATFKNLEFIPFYKLHDARYMIYWQ